MGQCVLKAPASLFSTEQLIAFAYPHIEKKLDWRYSNTGYLLTQMIEAKAGGSSYADQLRANIIAPTGIEDLYYYPGIYPKPLIARTVAGYFDNTGNGNETLAPLLKKDVRGYSLSWAQGAGAIVATPHAIVLWARDLYQGNVLTPGQRKEMETLVSTATGKPIARVDSSNPRGFGLGVSQIYDPKLGRVWFYEGITLGYRMLHAYFPSKDVVIAVGLNSQPTKDHIGELLAAIMATLKKNDLF